MIGNLYVLTDWQPGAFLENITTIPCAFRSLVNEVFIPFSPIPGKDPDDVDDIVIRFYNGTIYM